jgi:hypothetical protein
MEIDSLVNQDGERLLKTRITIMQTRNKKNFTSIIEAASNSFKNDQKKKLESKKADDQKKNQSYDRYGEVEEDRFWKDRLKGNGTMSDLLHFTHRCRT